MATDFIAYVPKDPIDNLRWRSAWWEAASTDVGLQRAFRQAAFDDPLFFFNAFGWCFEPRSAVKIRPFVTWPHQDPCIVAMDDAISDAERTEEPIDLVLDKSRGQGATWMYLLVFLRRWLRDDLFSVGLVTRNEKLVDSQRDPDTLMWKVVWALLRLPFWMMPDGFELSKCRNLTEHTLYNPERGGSFVGFAATGDLARGGRKTVFALDEIGSEEFVSGGKDEAAMNSVRMVTNCCFLVSTFGGDTGVFYDACRKESSARKVVLDWKDNPTQNRGLYEVRKGKVIPCPGHSLSAAQRARIESQHKRLAMRGFVVAEGKPRSIWYNEQCLRPGATPRGIARELDRDPHGAVSKVFDTLTIETVRVQSAMPPLIQGRLVADLESGHVVQPYVVVGEGELKLWVRFGLDGKIPYARYVVGTDISAGTAGDYSSNSSACVINRDTGEQVGEWASNAYNTTRFAYMTLALARWFHNALIIYEANFSAGYGKVLIDDVAYPNLYMREVEIEGVHKKTQKPGFWMTNDDVKLKLFERMQEAMAIGAFTPRSEVMLDECKEYQWKNGRIIHVGATTTNDEAGKGRPHADRAIAASLAWFACDEEPVIVGEDEHSAAVIPPGCMAERLREFDVAADARMRDSWLRSDAVDTFLERDLMFTRDPWR